MLNAYNTQLEYVHLYLYVCMHMYMCVYVFVHCSVCICCLQCDVCRCSHTDGWIKYAFKKKNTTTTTNICCMRAGRCLQNKLAQSLSLKQLWFSVSCKKEYRISKWRPKQFRPILKYSFSVLCSRGIWSLFVRRYDSSVVAVMHSEQPWEVGVSHSGWDKTKVFKMCIHCLSGVRY